VSSWSISAHTFGALDKEGFSKYWEEIYRVLNNQGEAYIFPLHYSNVDEDAFVSSLIEFVGRHNFQWKFIDDTGQETNNFAYAETLCLKKGVK